LSFFFEVGRTLSLIWKLTLASSSIVTVHELNGNPIETWTDHKTKAFWLKDFLFLNIVGVRVMTFGYNADAAFGNTTVNINDHAKDLLSSLINKREEDEVAVHVCRYSCGNF